MFFVENLLSGMFEMMPESLEYQKSRELEALLLGELRAHAGEELVDKLLDAQAERAMMEYRQFFLWGLRLGAEVSEV